MTNPKKDAYIKWLDVDRFLIWSDLSLAAIRRREGVISAEYRDASEAYRLGVDDAPVEGPVEVYIDPRYDTGGIINALKTPLARLE